MRLVRGGDAAAGGFSGAQDSEASNPAAEQNWKPAWREELWPLRSSFAARAFSKLVARRAATCSWRRSHCAWHFSLAARVSSSPAAPRPAREAWPRDKPPRSRSCETLGSETPVHGRGWRLGKTETRHSCTPAGLPRFARLQPSPRSKRWQRPEQFAVSQAYLPPVIAEPQVRTSLAFANACA